MSKDSFTQWKEDQEFINSEYVNLIVRDGTLYGRLLLQKVLWMNPVGLTSERVSFEVPLLDEYQRNIVQRTVVVGWQCTQYKSMIFATDLRGLRHEPCCRDERPG